MKWLQWLYIMTPLAVRRSVRSDQDSVMRTSMIPPSNQYRIAEFPRPVPYDEQLILDVGCGTGESTLSLMERYPRGVIIGIDEDSTKLKRAREIVKGCTFVEGDMTKPIFFPDMFEMISFNHSYHKFYDKKSVLTNCISLLKPKGMIEIIEEDVRAEIIDCNNRFLSVSCEFVQHRGWLHVMKRNRV